MDVLAALFGVRNPAFMCAAGFSDSPHVCGCSLFLGVVGELLKAFDWGTDYSGYTDEGEYFLLYQISTGGT
jgi:5-oxoprolinase (ATP-hydrolysing)